MRSIVLLTSLLLACGSDTVTTDGGAAGSTTNGSTTLDSSTTTTSTSTSTSGADETSQTSVAFVNDPDLGQGDECSIYAQDCPAGFKCMPYANGGGNSWNAWGCFPVVEDPAGPGEPCMVEGSGTSGIDTCALGSMCWNPDPDTHEGTCAAFCLGDDLDDVYCEDPNDYCYIPGEAVFVLCLPRCHPLEDDCPEGQGCYPAGDDFQCRFHAQDTGNAGDPCELDGHCAPPTYCIPQDYVPGCTDSFNCCTSFCTIGDDAVCLPGQTCQAWYVPGDAPPGFEDLGVCVLP